MPFHAEPIASFWSEWWAAAIGLAAAVAGLFAARDCLRFSALLILPALVLAALLLQFAVGRVAFPHVGLLYAVYVLWAGLLMVLGRHLADSIGLARLADVLAAAFALGALIGASVTLVQWLGVAGHVPWISADPGGVARSNLAQSNHHAHYSWLGIASGFYLCGRGYLSRARLWLLILPIGFSSAVGGSRSVFLYPVVILAALAWLHRREPPEPKAGLLTDAVLLLPVVVALNLVGAWASPRIHELAAWLGIAASAGSSVMSGARLYESVSGFSPRLAIMRTAWEAFGEHPWLGQGAGNYAWASFEVAGREAGEAQFMVAEHAHNLVFHLLAEFGAPLTAAVLLVLAFWARRFARRPWRLEQFWCAAVLGIGALHSLLEYPLWYSYFLGPAALLLGATDSARTMALARRRARVYLVLVAVAGASILTNLRIDYARIEAASNYPLAADPDRERAWRISMERLLQLHRESLLSPWVLMAFTNLSEPSRQLAKDRADLCARGIRFAPARSLLTRCAMQLAIAGRDADAQRLLQSVLRAFPAERAATVAELEQGTRAYPELIPLRPPRAGD